MEGKIDFAKGKKNKPIFIDDNYEFLPLICYEIIFSNLIRKSINSRTSLLLNITNDAWFGNSIGPSQHFQFAKIRAVEFGIPVVRVANTGFSGFITPFGEVINKIELNKKGISTLNLINNLESTLFKKYGNKILILLIIILFTTNILFSYLINRKRYFFMTNYLFTLESVSEGHPDKISDLISDTIVDMMISKYPFSRVACETLVTSNKVVIAGEYRLNKEQSINKDEIEQNVREAIKKVGYEQEGFHWKNSVENYLHAQSSDIAIGVDQGENKEEGAGDQGLMFGYAVDETDVLMPAPIYYSHLILKKLASLRHSREASFLRPDSKSQLTIEYENDKPVGTKKIVVSTQHVEGYDQKDLKDFIINVINETLPKGWICSEDQIFVNPTGRL